MFFPYRVDVPMERWPIANFAILGLMVAAFVGQRWAEATGQLAEIIPFILSGWDVRGMLGHMWLHAGVLHLVGNMIFLWVFGNAVCAKFGNAAYAAFYVLAGVLAAAVHLVADGGAAVGASGAINGVVGAFLVLYPLNDVSCVLWLVFWMYRFSLSSIWLILMYFVFDVWGAATGGGGVAYFAHLGGFAAGFGVATLALKLNWIEMTRAEQSLYNLLRYGRYPGLAEFRPPRRGKEERWEEVAKAPPSPGKPPGPPTFDGYVEEPQGGASDAGGTGPPEDRLVRFRCRCGQVLKADARFAGRRARCPNCSAALRIPAADR
ncbi:MAG: rhomboid family intramembrane serine protease [Planctomycetota bacterium]